MVEYLDMKNSNISLKYEKSNNYKREVSEALERFSTILKIDLINAEYVPGILNFLNKIKKIKKIYT